MDVGAVAGPDGAARVAYVALEEGAQKSRNTEYELASLVRKTLPPIIAVMEPSAKPEMIERSKKFAKSSIRNEGINI